jgi:hypothetical protein
MLSNDESQVVVNAAEASKLALSQFTIPFYTKQDGKVFVAGSGVLIQIGEKYFVVTTAHMFGALCAEWRGREHVVTIRPGPVSSPGDKRSLPSNR